MAKEPEGPSLRLLLFPQQTRQRLRRLRQGLTYKEIGEVLGISPRTLRYKLAQMRDAGIELPA